MDKKIKKEAERLIEVFENYLHFDCNLLRENHSPFDDKEKDECWKDVLCESKKLAVLCAREIKAMVPDENMKEFYYKVEQEVPYIER